MKYHLTTTFAVAALATVAIAAAGTASAAPINPQATDSVQSTISKLQTDGYDVVVMKVGSAPLSQCTLIGVRGAHTFARTDHGFPGYQTPSIPTVVDRMIYVDARC